MIKFIKNKIEEGRIKKSITRLFNPEGKFIKETRILFLNELSKKYGVRAELVSARPLLSYIKVLRVGVAAVFILLFSASGLVAYADKSNVGPNAFLYEFKRIGEDVQITIAPKEKKYELYQEFAQRRLNEIKQVIEEEDRGFDEVKNVEIQNQNRGEGKSATGTINIIQPAATPFQTIKEGEDKKEKEFIQAPKTVRSKEAEEKIKELKNDFAKKLEIIEEEIDDNKIMEQKVVDLCKNGFSVIEEKRGESKRLEQFKNRCEKLTEIRNNQNQDNKRGEDMEQRRQENRIEDKNTEQQKEQDGERTNTNLDSGKNIQEELNQENNSGSNQSGSNQEDNSGSGKEYNNEEND